ncbi:hypothetical protein [Pacificibacter marinus]|uniref:Glycoprotease family protein n=1 Tax=Pacificibacter marinus TaxID=658057 RepID=A0A1Y5SKT8_9RHOB|nr:hypothetical protein [Pacificibacter marinus]SEK58090.1 tRNA threonylcarbamoyladenosine biosynthesis protein TsaB [Pacificibacter marinus]SLN42957.1 Glycoprotease family protein [Pacificibacter marinus]
MTKLTFLLQTSNGVPVMGLAKNDTVIFDSASDATLLGSRDYRSVLQTGLRSIGAELNELTEIFVDIGPGGLGITRTGVAFANGLGFALDIPTIGLPAFDLLGTQLADQTDDPVVIIRKAANPFVHFGIFKAGKLAHYEHCEREIAVKHIQRLDKYAIAGNVDIEGIDAPEVNAATIKTMLKVAKRHAIPDTNARAYPIVEALS